MTVKTKIFYCLLNILLFNGNVFSENIHPSPQEEKDIVIFDADKNEIKDFVNYTTTWRNGSNMLPKLSLIENSQGRWMNFTYEGTNGSGISRLNIESDSLHKTRQDDIELYGLKLQINYEGTEFDKIEVKALFPGENDFEVFHVPLEKGVKEYTLTKGFRKASAPADWAKLKHVLLCSEKSNMAFMLKKISILVKKSDNKNVSLKMTSIKKTQEIFLAFNEISENRTINEIYLNKIPDLKGFYLLKDKNELEDKTSPVKAKITYDKDYFYISTDAEFPQKPISNITKNDDDVYQDEAIEFFFSPWNDNNKKIQFVTNLTGAVFDSLRDYDLTAADIISSVQWNLSHMKKISYQNGVWKTFFSASLKDLKIDLSKYRFMNFQLAQNYSGNNNSGKYKSVSWAPTNSFPNPLDFGVLVFNRKPFGNGDIEIKEISSIKKNAENGINLSFKVSLKNFKDGEYKIETIVAMADYSIEKNNEKMKLSSQETQKTIKINSIKDLNGVYTAYICIYNENNDLKVFAVNFENVTPLKDMFGENVFCPTPKKVIWTNGTFNAGKANKIVIPETASERTIKTAHIFQNKISGFSASQYTITRDSGLKNSIRLNILQEIDFEGEKIKLKPEGYSIDVRPDGVEITGADEAGLYYGCVTFMQLLKAPMKTVDEMPVKSVKILDWPDVANRMVRIEHPWHFKNRKFKETPPIEYLTDWIERFVAENKFNRVYLDISMLIKFKRQPEFNGLERVFTIEDLKKLGNFCKEHFIDIIPAFQVGGHANLWLLDYHPELREKGYSNQADITHPEHNKIILNCILDIVEAINPQYFSPKGDEWWHTKAPNEIPDEVLKNTKTRDQALLEFYIDLNKWLKKRNIKMQIFEDMLNPRHNGKRYDIYKIIDRFPKDIIITPWGNSPDITASYFMGKGFEIWGNATSFWTYGETVKSKVKGMGFSTYNLGTDWMLFRKTANFSIYEIFMGADNAWNILREKEPSLMGEIASGKLPALREMYALKPNISASPQITAVDIQKYMNRSLEEELSKKVQDHVLSVGKQDVGNIPMMISNKKENCIILEKGKPVSIPIEQNCASIIFLHTVNANELKAKEFDNKAHWRNWPYGYILGNYILHYNDGTKEKLPVRLCWNIGVANANPLYRTTNDNRYIMPLKTEDGSYRFLYQWECPNPYPDKKIMQITYEDNGEFNLPVILVAISCRASK